MKLKTSELNGQALNWAVALCDNLRDADSMQAPLIFFMGNYCTNWDLGGPIIERERIRIDCPWNPGLFEATCKIDGVTAWVKGDTVLVAAMRCYVASKLGAEVEVPDEVA